MTPASELARLMAWLESDSKPSPQQEADQQPAPAPKQDQEQS